MSAAALRADFRARLVRPTMFVTDVPDTEYEE
jgi:hypothetical protein